VGSRRAIDVHVYILLLMVKD